MELLEDSVLYDSNSPALVNGEENKLYTSGLSLNASAIKNTLVAFLDLYFAYSRSPELRLAVFASADHLAQERISAEQRKALGYEEKQKTYDILRKLVAKDALSDEELAIARAIVKKEYCDQYKGKTEKGFRALVEEMSSGEFKAFLSAIDWSISNETNESLEQQALEQVKGCRFYSHRHENLEKPILACLLDELEKRSGRPGVTDRLLTTDTLKLIFQEMLLAAPIIERPIDPASEGWDDIKRNDLRNLEEKIRSVCPGVTDSMLGVLARRCSLARKVEPGGDREMKAVLRRVLDVCEEELMGIVLSPEMSSADIIQIIDTLASASELNYAHLRQAFRYRARDKAALKGAVLTLFDDCYLAFDQK